MGDTRPQRPVGGHRGPDPLVRVADREPADRSRTSPRMRFDLLQIVAWGIGLLLIVAGLVALARAGFDQLTLFEPVVEVAGLTASPLLALLMLLVGLLLLAGATGEVDERALRIGGALIAVIGVVWLVEPGAFADYLGISAANGRAALTVGVVLTAVSFVPPLSIRRPGVAGPPSW